MFLYSLHASIAADPVSPDVAPTITACSLLTLRMTYELVVLNSKRREQKEKEG